MPSILFDSLSVSLEDRDGVYGLAEVPQAESSVAGRGHHEPRAVVRRRVRQLVVVT